MRHPRREMIVLSLAAAACLLMTGATVRAVLAYNAFNPAPYSPLNHFYSELGWARVSPAAGIFNICLSLAAILNMPLLWLLGRRLGTRLARWSSAVGLIAAVACGVLGFLPLGGSVHLPFSLPGGKFGPHLLAAGIFFWWWMLTMALFLIALWRSPAGRKMTPLMAATILTLAASLAFLAAPHQGIIAQLLKSPQTRESFYWISTLEWVLIVATGLWLLAAIHGLWMVRENSATGDR